MTTGLAPNLFSRKDLVLLTFMGKTMGIGFPILAIKGDDRDLLWLINQASYIDINPIRVRSRNIKWFHTTNLAKLMLSNACIKSIGCELLFS